MLLFRMLKWWLDFPDPYVMVLIFGDDDNRAVFIPENLNNDFFKK